MKMKHSETIKSQLVLNNNTAPSDSTKKQGSLQKVLHYYTSALILYDYFNHEFLFMRVDTSDTSEETNALHGRLYGTWLSHGIWTTPICS